MENNHIEISVIIPIYNAEAYLPACIDSLLLQGDLLMEVILINDGSTDHSEAIADQYANQDSRIKVVHQLNGGASVARNVGLELAQGEYIAFVDSDDWIKENSLSVLYREAAKYQADIVMGNMCYIRQNKIIASPYQTAPKEIRYQSFSGKECYNRLVKTGAYTPMVWNYIFRRKFLKNIQARFEEGIVHEDTLCCPIVLCQAEKMVIVDVDFYYYRQHEESVMHTTNLRHRIKSLFRVTDRLIEFAEFFMKSKLLLSLSFVFFYSCQFVSQKATITKGIIHIDISKNYPEIGERASDFISEMEYIPLETNKDVLVDQSAIFSYFSEKFIMLIAYRRGEIFVFDRNGKIVTLLNRKGRGPEEYSAISAVVLDEMNEEIFVFDIGGTGRIVVYSLTGEYKRTLNYPVKLLLTPYNFDDETMLVYDTRGLYDKTYNKKPYMLISKRDGKITYILNIYLPVRYDTKVYNQIKDADGQLWTFSDNISICNRRHDGQDFVISDVSSDTIYRFTKSKDLIPLIVRTPSVHSTNPHLACTTALISDKFIFLYITTLDYFLMQKGEAPPAKIIMYEFENGEISRVNYNPSSNVNILQKNIETKITDVMFYKLLYKRNRLTEELKQLVETLDEEDNPIITITKFK